ncbi:endolytic peptidoglycan transglycosylase RlpA [Erwinia tasmaniensis]|uniref:endolytic peptidoglycan transglycosylase RlpA n=1 Tax=Erwinia tasmaniensis TaxID=338565 RepID=UPI003A4D6FBD
MRKDWLWIGLASALLAACTTTDQQAPVQQHAPAYSGPVVEISGADPHYEPINPATSQDYTVNGKTWRIIKDPSNFSETGLASAYGSEASGNRTATGEEFDANALTAAHPTLPLPSYVRVTNLANGRMIVVRVNDRGPYIPGRIIDLSQAAGDRLNISNNTRVRVDYIAVAPDGSLSGPGTIGTTVAKQSYALPPRPDIGGGMTVMGAGTAASTASAQPAIQQQDVQQSGSQQTPAAAADTQQSGYQQPAVQQTESHPVDNSSLNSDESLGAPVRSNGFLGAPQPLRNGVLEGSETAAVAQGPATTAPASSHSAVSSASSPAAPQAAAPAIASVANGGNWVVQVGALSDSARAQQLKNTLSRKFGVPGTVSNQGKVYRVQLGHFSSRQQASDLQRRLLSEAQQQSFITVAH